MSITCWRLVFQEITIRSRAPRQRFESILPSCGLKAAFCTRLLRQKPWCSGPASRCPVSGQVCVRPAHRAEAGSSLVPGRPNCPGTDRTARHCPGQIVDEIVILLPDPVDDLPIQGDLHRGHLCRGVPYVDMNNRGSGLRSVVCLRRQFMQCDRQILVLPPCRKVPDEGTGEKDKVQDVLRCSGLLVH